MTLRSSCEADLAVYLAGSDLARDEEAAALATMVAAATAIETASAADSTPSKQLSIRVQALLQALEPELSAHALHEFGVYGGAIGERTLLLYEGSEHGLVLDPWAGIVAVVGYDDLFQGFALSMSEIFSLELENASASRTASAALVLAALQAGAFTPSDLLYFRPSPDFEARSVTEKLETTTIGEQMAENYKTPGGYRLAVEQFGLTGKPILRANRSSTTAMAKWVDFETIASGKVALSCVAAAVASVRADPGAVIALRTACDEQLRGAFKALNPGPRELDAIFVTFLAHLFAPYGPNNSATLPGLLVTPTLECSGYALLAGYLFDILEGAPSRSLRMLGFQHPTFGNHAQLLFEGQGRALLLDPTAGIAAEVKSFDDLLLGHATDPSAIVAFYRYTTAEIDALPWFVEAVYNSITMGKYRPSDLLYFAPRPSFLAGQLDAPATAGDFVMKAYLTPGGHRKAVTLGFGG